MFAWFYLVVALTEEFQSLGPLVHKDSVQVARLHRANLDGFLAPAHDLIRMDVGWREGDTDGVRTSHFSM